MHRPSPHSCLTSLALIMLAGCVTPSGLSGIVVQADAPEEPGAPTAAQEQGEEDEGEEEPGEEEPGLTEVPASQGASRPAGPGKRQMGWIIASAAAGGVALGTFIGGVTRTSAAEDAAVRHDRDAFDKAQTGQYALYAVAGTSAAVSLVSLMIFLFAGDGEQAGEHAGLKLGPGPGEAGLAVEWSFR